MVLISLNNTLRGFSVDRLAHKLCGYSDIHHKLAAFVVKGGTIRANGFNKRSFYGSTHAEIDALRKMKYQKGGSQGCDLYIYRFRADGGYALAKPCVNCMKNIIKAGIKRVFYSDYDNQMKIMNVSKTDMDKYCYGVVENYGLEFVRGGGLVRDGRL